MNAQSFIEKLKLLSIFSDFKDDIEALTKLSGMMELRHFKKNHAIIKEGEEGDELFILYKGTVEIGKNTLEKELYVVTLLDDKQNAFFGEMALIDNDKRSATVLAKTDCDLLVFSKKNFLDFGDHNPRIGLLITRRISQILGQRLRRGNQDIITLFEALVGEIEESS